MSRTALSGLTLAALFAAAPAFSQGVPPAASPEVATAAADEPTTDIIVTGSRIARRSLEGVSPVTIIGQQDIQLRAASTNIENVLNDLPQVTATQSSTSNNPGGGVATVNLRALGAQRTLVLVDGRRYVSFDVSQVVDLNTIPSALIQRVDVVTGGQSAVYGSDAIAGVVNFVLKRDFSGVELNSSYDVTQRGDGQIFDVNATIGTNFDEGRGNVTLFADFTKRKATFAGDRNFSTPSLTQTFDADGNPTGLVAGGSGSVPQGRVTITGLGAATGLGCNSQDFTGNVNTCYDPIADAYNYSPVNYLQVPQERYLVAGMAQYEISDAFKPYLEAQFINNRVNNQLAATPISNGTPFGTDGVIGQIPLQVNSPFFTPAFQAALRTLDTDGNGYVNANFNFRTTQIGPRFNADERNAFRVVAGMKGDIGAGFSYDGYYMYSRTKNSQRQLGNVRIDNFIDAVTTAFDANGNLVCASGNAGCVPANIFGLNNLSQAAIDYISIGATNLETYHTQVASFAITNPSLFDFGAGGVAIALGAEYRKEQGRIEPDTFLSSGNVAGFNPGQPTGGGYHVREFFGELRVPLLRDTFIHRLELSGAARQTKYSNAPGNVFTWSAGAELDPFRDLTLRGNYQKAVRGPSVNELFLGNTVSFAGNADQCGTSAALSGQLNAICVAQFTAAGAPLSNIGNPTIQDSSVNPLTFLGGNPDLKEETAKTYTFGAVFKPTFLRGFSASVDYYNIKITNQITGGIGTDNIGDLCFNRLNTAFCGTDVIRRNAIGEIDSFSDLFANTGRIHTAGIDGTVGYNSSLGSMFGADDVKLSLAFNGTYLLRFDVTTLAGVVPYTDCAGKFGQSVCGAPTPKWRHTFRPTLTFDKVSFSTQWRYLGKVRDDNPGVTYSTEKFKAQNYFDFTLAADVADNFTLTGGVSNAFDKKPPLSASAQNGGNGEQSNTYPTFYDVLGRSFFVSGKVKF